MSQLVIQYIRAQQSFSRTLKILYPVFIDFQGLPNTVSSFYWFSRTSKYCIQFLLIFKDFQILYPVFIDFQGLPNTVSSFYWFSRTSKYCIQFLLIFKDFQILYPVFIDFQGLPRQWEGSFRNSVTLQHCQGLCKLCTACPIPTWCNMARKLKSRILTVKFSPDTAKK